MQRVSRTNPENNAAIIEDRVAKAKETPLCTVPKKAQQPADADSGAAGPSGPVGSVSAMTSEGPEGDGRTGSDAPWYAAALARELRDRPLGRTVRGRPLVLFRTGDGRPAALADRCPHRNVPLSLGRCRDGVRLLDLAVDRVDHVLVVGSDMGLDAAPPDRRGLYHANVA